jgi:polar amino acid transport system permease protein
MSLDFAFLLEPPYRGLIIQGILTTFELFGIALVCGLALSVLVVFLGERRQPAIRALVRLFIEYHRNVPSVVQILVWYFGAPQLLPSGLPQWVNHSNPQFLFASIALSLNVSAYMAQDIVSGIRSIAGGQREAARSIGLSEIGAMRHVILPQALRIVAPTLLNRTLMLFKDTSFAMAIGVRELTYQTKSIDNLTFRTFELFTVSTVFYATCALALMAAAAFLVRRSIAARGQAR